MDGLNWGDILGSYTPAGLLGLTVWMILTGRLVPRFFYKQKVDEAAKWEAVATTSQKQTNELLEYARAADAVLKALPSGARPRGGVKSEVD